MLKITAKEKQFILKRRKAISKIATPIRDMENYLKNRIKELSSFKNEKSKLEKDFKIVETKKDKDGYIIFEEIERSLFRNNFPEVSITLNNDVKKVNKQYENYLESMMYYVKIPETEVFESRKFYDMMEKFTDGIFKPDNYSNISSLKQDKEIIDKIIKDELTGERFNNTMESYSDGDEYEVMFKKSVKLVNDLSTFINKMFIFYTKTANKFKEHLEWKKFAREKDFGKSTTLKKDKIETLYHATLYKNDLLKKGFEKTKPKHMIGLGYFGASPEKLISFTHDLKIAQDISRFFKESAMIMQNKLKWSTILDYYKREKIKLPTKTFDYPPENLFDVIKYYRAYLMFSKMRSDPVSTFDNDRKTAKAFEKVKSKEIGIIKAKINMEHPDIEYVPGEKEYRVPPEAILEVKAL